MTWLEGKLLGIGLSRALAALAAARARLDRGPQVDLNLFDTGIWLDLTAAQRRILAVLQQAADRQLEATRAKRQKRSK